MIVTGFVIHNKVNRLKSDCTIAKNCPYRRKKVPDWQAPKKGIPEFVVSIELDFSRCE
jgi:hypothetical protein